MFPLSSSALWSYFCFHYDISFIRKSLDSSGLIDILSSILGCFVTISHNYSIDSWRRCTRSSWFPPISKGSCCGADQRPHAIYILFTTVPDCLLFSNLHCISLLHMVDTKVLQTANISKVNNS